jgi:hypothetical protein
MKITVLRKERRWGQEETRLGNVVDDRTRLRRSLCPTATAVSTSCSVRVHDSRSNAPSIPFTQPRYDEWPPIKRPSALDVCIAAVKTGSSANTSYHA